MECDQSITSDNATSSVKIRRLPAGRRRGLGPSPRNSIGPSTALYSEAAGSGFESGATAGAFYFSVRVPEEGNYKVTVTSVTKNADN